MHFSPPVALVLVLAAIVLVSGFANYVALFLLRRQKAAEISFAEQPHFCHGTEAWGADDNATQFHRNARPHELPGRRTGRLNQPASPSTPHPRDLGFTQRYIDGRN